MGELYKIDLNELNYYSSLVSHPEPDILELESQVGLKNSTVNNDFPIAQMVKNLPVMQEARI